MIKYIKGDLLNADQSIIIHQVNCKGVMGSGVAMAIRTRYPSVYQLYVEHDFPDEDYDPYLLGSVDYLVVETGRTIINLFGQYNFLPRGARHTDYEALAIGFEKIKEVFPCIDVAIPLIGCGLGGGKWEVVQAIINTIFDDRDVYVYQF